MPKFIATFFSFVLTYIALGRKGAIPIGITLFHSWKIVFLYMLLIEFVQIPLFYFLLGPLASRLGWVTKLKLKFASQKIKIKQSKYFQYAQKIGALGVFLVVVMPAGTGGVLGGVILSKLLNIDFYKGLFSIIMGILVCNLVLVLGVEGFKQLVLVPIQLF